MLTINLNEVEEELHIKINKADFAAGRFRPQGDSRRVSWGAGTKA